MVMQSSKIETNAPIGRVATAMPGAGMNE